MPARSGWPARHHLVTALLAGHLPALVYFALLANRPFVPLLSVLVPIAALLALAVAPGDRLRRSLAAALGLVASSGLVVHLAHGAAAAQVHLVVIVVVIGWYEDWRPLIAGVLAAVASYLLAGGLDLLQFAARPALRRDLLVLVLVRIGFVIAAAATVTLFWRREPATADNTGAPVSSAPGGTPAPLPEATQIREDLIASVSHEFRTPLTAIRGAAATLKERGEQIDADDRISLLEGIIEHGTRLSRLLEDMLAAASAAPTDPAVVSDVTAALERLPGRGLTVSAETGLVAYIDRRSLNKLLTALVSYAVDHRRADRPAELAARGRDGDIMLRLRYVSDSVVGEDEGRLLEAFGSRESAATGRPASLGLYVARRIAEVHGGSARASAADGTVTVEIQLRALRKPAPASHPAPVPVDAPGDAPAPDEGSAPSAASAPDIVDEELESVDDEVSSRR